jgi:ribosome-interacting GTPase 1
MNKSVVAEKPLILDATDPIPTIRDVAIKIHHKFFESFDYAIVIRKDARQLKKKVGLDYELKENDIIELHIK